ncbi:MAG: RES family NAD+ phosphorylase [Shewanella sp.]|nr:RES family NAD+ phosphorylase [Shewanella sp.]
MKLYRITKEAFVENYNGRGASFNDGARWNQKGQPVVYFALSASVAMLEIANYTPSPRLIPKNSIMCVYEIPETVETDTLCKSKLPEDWDMFPYPESTQKIGGEWLAKGDKFGLIVPSSAVAGGLDNILICNPLHDDVSKIKLISKLSNIYNPRTFSSL